ncbi:hypothetical protein EFR84_17310 [Rhizobium chutanense]|uniref:Uncharacterized protein n=1 Tax=Rhizobium chutanense TaxID=2035448 RepID=A0A432P0G4_9HYPH|nr:hypothetical protein EFR84_17310 [Rhizobium chutanense]
MSRKSVQRFCDHGMRKIKDLKRGRRNRKIAPRFRIQKGRGSIPAPRFKSGRRLIRPLLPSSSRSQFPGRWPGRRPSSTGEPCRVRRSRAA